MEDALAARYALLKSHVRGRPDLQLGAVSKGDFLSHWENNVALHVPSPEAAAAGPRGTREAKDAKNKILKIGIPASIRNVKFKLDGMVESARGNACPVSDTAQ